MRKLLLFVLGGVVLLGLAVGTLKYLTRPRLISQEYTGDKGNYKLLFYKNSLPIDVGEGITALVSPAVSGQHAWNYTPPERQIPGQTLRAALRTLIII